MYLRYWINDYMYDRIKVTMPSRCPHPRGVVGTLTYMDTLQARVYFRSRFEEQAAGMAALRLAVIAARRTGCSEDIYWAQADWDAALHRLFLLQHVVAGIEQEIVVLGLA